MPTEGTRHFDIVEPSSTSESALAGFDIVESAEGSVSKSLKGFDVIEPAEPAETTPPQLSQSAQPRARAKQKSQSETSAAKTLSGFDVIEDAEKSKVVSGASAVSDASAGAVPVAAAAVPTLDDFNVVEDAEAPTWGHLQFLKYLWKKGVKQSRHLHDK